MVGKKRIWAATLSISLLLGITPVSGVAADRPLSNFKYQYRGDLPEDHETNNSVKMAQSIRLRQTVSEALQFADTLRRQYPEFKSISVSQAERTVQNTIAGTYEGKGKGFAGDVIVTITIDSNGKITDATVTGASETPVIGGAALAFLAEQIKATGTVDGVSGATQTSIGAKEALEAALAQARAQAAQAQGTDDDPQQGFESLPVDKVESVDQNTSTDDKTPHFSQIYTYTENLFQDVKATDWFSSSVKNVYEYGLMRGQSENIFGSAQALTLGETLAMAARLHNIYHGGDGIFAQSTPWYQVYVDYAAENGIFSAEALDYNAAAPRAQFAYIIYNSLPPEALPIRNQIPDGGIPDMPMDAAGAPAVYALYRAGVLTGRDLQGTFSPYSSIDRASVAAIITRMVIPEERKTFTLDKKLPIAPDTTTPKTELSSEEIFQKCSPAVVFIQVYDKWGKPSATGSGFFIDPNGTMITNYHVIKGCTTAEIETSDQHKRYSILGVYAYNEKEDWAVLKVNGSGFSHLEVDASATFLGGSTVYAIGSPLGLQNSISQGLISNPKREVQGISYIQTTASISSGSSGGALINKYGCVIGITSAMYTDGQNLNLAVPMSYVNYLYQDSYIPLNSISTSSLVENPLEYLNSFIMTYGDLDYLLNVSSYNLELTSQDNHTYKFCYVPKTGVTYIKESYDTAFSKISTTLYFNGLGSTDQVSKAIYSVDDSAFPLYKMGYGFVERGNVLDQTAFNFYDWIGNLDISQSVAENHCFQMVVNLIYAADAILSSYDQPLTMQDFGFVY